MNTDDGAQHSAAGAPQQARLQELATWPVAGPPTIVDGILAATSDCVKVISSDGVVLFINRRGVELIELVSADDVLGRPYADIWPEEGRAKIVAAIEGAAAGRLTRVEGFCPTAKGAPRWWEASFVPFVPNDGGASMIVGISRDITDLRTAERAAHDAQLQLALVEDAVERRVAVLTSQRSRIWNVSPDMMGVGGLDGVFESSNPAWQTVLGWSEAHIARTPFTEFLHPDDLARSLAAFEALTQRGESVVRFENRYRHHDGSYRWLSWVAVLEGEKVHCTARDITDDKARADKLVARTTDLDRIWRNSRDLLVIADLSGVFLSVNPGWTAVLGHEPHEVVGHSFQEFVWSDDALSTAAAVGHAAGAGEVTDFENRYRHKDGTPRWISWRTRTEGELIHGYGRHVTDAKLAAAELASAEDRLRQSQKLEAVGQLTGGVAHDFNNLLTIISTSVGLLRRPELPAERRARHLGSITDAVKRASTLTAQLLAFARRQALQPVVFDAAGNILAIREMLGTLTGPRIAVRLETANETCWVDADPSQFDTAIVNLVANARDAINGTGRLTIAVHPVTGIPPIRGYAGVPGDFVAVCVADTGTGIEPALLSSIFEPFFTTKEVGHGTGLGLSQVFGFAKQSGGDVDVESVLAEGTTFTLYLPRSKSSGANAPVEFLTPKATASQGTRVLVVEDNNELAASVEEALQMLGYATTTVASGREALAELRRPDRPFDIVFSDVVMSGMSGIELAAQIGLHYPTLPVLLTSGYSHVLAQRTDDTFNLLPKPYAIEQLDERLKAVLAAHSSKVTG